MKFVVFGDGQEMYYKGWVCMYRVVVSFIKTFFSIILYFRQHSGSVSSLISLDINLTEEYWHLDTTWLWKIIIYLIIIMIRKTVLNVLWHLSRLFQVSRIPTKQPVLSVIEQEALQDIEMECGRWLVQDIHQPWLEQHLLVGSHWTH